MPIFFESAEDFRRWLEANAASATELLVGFHKVGSGRRSMSWPVSVDEALCFGWIDGVRKRIDEGSYQIRFTPRKAGSVWSAANIRKFEQLQLQGRAAQAGIDAYARRRADRSAVYSYEQKETASFTEVEVKAFKRRKVAWSFFEATPQSYKRAVLHWVASAKKQETRAARLDMLVQACEAGERLR